MAGRFAIAGEPVRGRRVVRLGEVPGHGRHGDDSRPPRPPCSSGSGVSTSPAAIRSTACTTGTMRARSQRETIAARTAIPTSTPPATAAARGAVARTGSAGHREGDEEDGGDRGEQPQTSEQANHERSVRFGATSARVAERYRGPGRIVLLRCGVGGRRAAGTPCYTPPVPSLWAPGQAGRPRPRGGRHRPMSTPDATSTPDADRAPGAAPAASFRFAVNVTPKEGILDPQGRAVEQRLRHLGVAGVGHVRVGRRVEMTVEGADEEAARALVERLAGELLADPLIENYAVEPLGGASSTTSAASRAGGAGAR